MEDQTTAIPDISAPNSSSNTKPKQPADSKKPHWSFFAIYDGHGGKKAADFISQHLHNYIKEETQQGASFTDALKKAFARVEDEWTTKATESDLSDGTTASVAIITDTDLIVGSVGDSELVLCRDGTAHGLCEVHNPKKNPAEAQRVVAEGGILNQERVRHPVVPGAYSLALSRAIGDTPFKVAEYTQGKPSGLSAEPDIRQMKLSPQDQFLVIACDGVWDVMSHKEVVDFCLPRLKECNDPQQVAEKLVDAVYKKGSSDNISVLLITLRDSSANATAPASGSDENDEKNKKMATDKKESSQKS